MITSKIAGCPAEQQGKYTFLGPEFVTGICFFCMQTADTLRALRAEKFLSVSRSCRKIKSSLPWHVTAWSTIVSNDLNLQERQFFCVSYMRAPSLYFTAARKSICDTWLPWTGMGAVDNQATDWVRERERERERGREREGDNKWVFFLSDLSFSIIYRERLLQGLPVFWFE